MDYDFYRKTAELEYPAAFMNFGEPSRSRTWDTLIKSQVLYQLS